MGTRVATIESLRSSRIFRIIGMFFILAFASLAVAAGKADAASISKFTTFECGAGSVRVYFPDLYTSGGDETVYYSPDLWTYTTSSGWQPYDTSKPWYSATVGRNGIYTLFGSKWFVYPSNLAAISVPFWNLPAGWYAVKGYFYGGTSHWGTVWGTSSTMCQVT